MKIPISIMLAATLAPVVSAQAPLPTANPQTQFAMGQNVVPVYEGWLRNADGTFTFVFGYFNRNWKEEAVIPPGADNKLEPGAPDRGQPTYFLPRRQPWVFRVRVPKDWGQQELVWTITAHGRTEKDRKSTRLNSSHVAISYAVFCLKKKNNKKQYYKHKLNMKELTGAVMSHII